MAAEPVTVAGKWTLPEKLPQNEWELLTSSPAHLGYVASNKTYKAPNHILEINKRLMDMERGEFSNLAVFLPPQHGKSQLISEYYPAWLFLVHPDIKVILASYSFGLAQLHGANVRNIVNEYGSKYFGISVDPSSRSSAHWTIKQHRGTMTSTSIGGGITGRDATIFLIDDPVKGAADALSTTYQENIWNWYVSVVKTRLKKWSRTVIIQTRWHENDLSGMILQNAEETGERWEVLSLPAIAEEDENYTYVKRVKGEPLWDRFGMEFYEVMKKTQGSYWFNALYQQRPQPPEGGMFKREWFEKSFYNHQTYAPPFDAMELAKFDDIIQVWDLTFKETETGSYVVGQVWGRKGQDFYLLDMYRKRTDFNGTLNAIRMVSQNNPRATRKILEDAASAQPVIATLKREIAGIVAERVQGDKQTRAMSITAVCETGNVHLPDLNIMKSGGLVKDVIDECSNFPFGKSDDIVDCMSMALGYFLFKPRPGIFRL